MREENLVAQNPWWANKASINEDEKIKNAMGRNHKLDYDFVGGNFLIVGPRQVGKTTYLKLLVRGLIEKVNPRNVLYFTCDLLKNSEEIVDLVRTFDSLAGSGQKYLFLDEVTFVDGWERAVKFLLDSGELKDKYLYVTGSSSVGLKKERFPGGKIRIKEFMPLDFRRFCELLGSDQLKRALLKSEHPGLNVGAILEFGKELIVHLDEITRLFNIYLQSGGYPRAFFELVEEGAIKEDTRRACFDGTIFDMTKLMRSEKISGAIILGVLRRYGSKFSLNSLAKEMEIGSHLTVRDYLELLESLYALRSYHQVDLAKKVVLYRKERKVYFTDPLLAQTFSTALNVELGPAQLVEGIVGEHLKRSFAGVYFHSGKREVDFVQGNAGVELEWQERASAKDFPRTGIRDKILLCKRGLDYMEERNLVLISAPIFLLGLPTEATKK